MVATTHRLAQIFCHPVKGFRPQELFSAQLLERRGVVGDRNFAFQFMDEQTPFEALQAPEQSAPWLAKKYLAVQHDWPELARLQASFDPQSLLLTINLDGKQVMQESSVTPEGRRALAQYVQNYLQHSTPFSLAKHPQVSSLRLIGDPHQQLTRYTDGEVGPVSLCSSATIEDLGQTLKAHPVSTIDPRRFRFNLLLAGMPAWEEQKLIGRHIRIGGCTLAVVKTIARCPNIDVHPETGVMDLALFAHLKAHYGHPLVGVKAEVVTPGFVHAGDDWEVL